MSLMDMILEAVASVEGLTPEQKVGVKAAIVDAFARYFAKSWWK